MSFEEPDVLQQEPPQTPAAMSARNIGLGAIWNMAAYVLPQLLTLVLSVLVARRMGPTEQGVQSYLMFIAMTVGTVYGLGLPSASEQAISRYLGENRPDLVRAFGLWAVRSSVVPAALSFVTVLGIGRLQYTAWGAAWVAAAVAATCVTTHAVVAQGLNGMHEFRIPSGIGVGCQIVTSIVCVVALVMGTDVATFIAIQAAGAVVSAVLTVRAYLKHLPASAGRPTAAELGEAKKSALRFAMVSGVVVLLDTVVAKRSEFVFLALFHHDQPEQIAFYSVAFAAAVAVAQVPAALVSIAMPVISRMLASGDHERVVSGYHSAQKMLLVLSAPAAGGLLGCGEALVLLAYGERYTTSAHLLLIATVAPVLAGPLGALASAALMGAGIPGAAARANVTAAVVTIVADIVLIWPFAAYGAAVAGGLGIIAGTWSLMRQARKHMGLRRVGVDVWWNMSVSLVATALPGVVLMALGAGNLVVLLAGAVLGLVSLGLVWAFLRPLTPDHLTMIGAVVSKLPASGRRVLEGFVTYEGKRRRH